MNVTIERNDPVRVITRVLAVMLLLAAPAWTSAANDPGQSRVGAPAGDGWQVLSSVPAANVSGEPPVVATGASTLPLTAAPASLAVAPVVLPAATAASGGALTFSVSPSDRNLRNALDRWLQTQGWQLAWKVDDDLPLEFNATFSGDFTSVLVQVMKATNHMRVPTRICRHSNNVIRVVARAANCQE
ncbi:toxin co-regulated pilus biosynthesis protein Q [Paraburkholderia sp. BL27I4N3]|uniref:toxin co-regulated pilus biosynthesis Q family protein n=1 Tax=Paraburkholderia sp. BL27I4N3 TaxID=1938805 RepID=UPI000E249B23|nr:toxin co-regulated pilus biosynthesis Q family protein [Paraburkholderia sp. BL27I4N3]REE07140.1 toxin co-regulated pilus biosynthesis protein Q [Paraburkholderia sp. BL27I4N3]